MNQHRYLADYGQFRRSGRIKILNSFTARFGGNRHLKLHMDEKSRISSDSSKLSCSNIESILERLQANRKSTSLNYLSIWRQFNKFLLQLDRMPESWEQRVALFCAYLVEFKKVQSSTLRSYVSAIKSTLKCDKYKWRDDSVWLNALFHSCKLSNNTLYVRFPIHFKLFEMIMFEVDRLNNTQPYLQILFKAIFATAYYGLTRISEITGSRHSIKAKNIEIADNKEKIKITLFSSKTHDVDSRPQEIKISSSEITGRHGRRTKFFCPFKIIRQYMNIRRGYTTENENFFIFSDGSTIPQSCIRAMLKSAIQALNLNSDPYSFQSFRIGRATDLLKFGIPIEVIKCLGRWKSNTVYKYL